LTFYDDNRNEFVEFSYREFLEAVHRAAHFMVNRLELGRGDRIATLSYNHHLTVVVYFAAWTLGICVVPINVAEDDDRIVYILDDAECQFIFAMPDLIERANLVTDRSRWVRDAIAMDKRSAKSAAPVLELEGMPATRPREADEVAPKDSAVIVYTSGTTGKPKGVDLAQCHLIRNAQLTADWFGLNPGVRMMCVLPIHHVNGMIVTLVTPMVAGGSVVLNRNFKSHVFWRRIAQERIEVVSVVPTILKYLLDADDDISKLRIESLRCIICGAGPLLVAVAEAFYARFRKQISHGYGLSETTAYACLMPPDLSDEEYTYWMTHYGYPSIGCPLPGVEMAILDPEGREVGAGESGEIAIRGPIVMDGYFKRDDANAKVFRFGWFLSGDQGFFGVDRNGRPFFFITARIKEVILRGGCYVSPLEIDAVLQQIPGVEVGLAVGFDNEYQGEEVGAYIVPKAGAHLSQDEVLRFCRARIQFPKCPKVVVFGNEVVTTSTGKLKRLSLKHYFADYLCVQFRDAQQSVT